jgi:hypothetical protein
MSKGRILLVAIPVVLLLALAGAVAGAVWYASPRKTSVTVDVTAPPGFAIQGTAEVDGHSQDLTGTGSTQFVLEGYRITYSLTSPENAGEFKVKAVIGGVALGTGSSGDPPKRGVRGWVKSGWAWESPTLWVEMFDKDEQTGWMSPPPP